MSHAQHPTSREQHAAHAEARTMVRALARQERRAAERALIRALRALVQPHEPHHFAPPSVAPVSPRRAWDWPAAPGGPDPTDFLPGGIC